MNDFPAAIAANMRPLLFVAFAMVISLFLIGPVAAQKLTASDGAAYDVFGQSTGTFGHSALVGAYGNDDNGAAYYFQSLDSASGPQTETLKLTASDGAANDNFGFRVSLSGDSALVGAYRDDDNGTYSGSAYYFKGLDSASGPQTETLKLTASDGAAGDFFGISVSHSGDSALVGANFDDDNGMSSGSAYCFRGLDSASGPQTETFKLTTSDGAAGDQFGYSVSLSGDSALVGAYRDSDNGSSSGSAYYFNGLDSASGPQTETLKLTASDGAANDRFGELLSLSGDSALVGAPYDDDSGSDSGSAYYFRDLDIASGPQTEFRKLVASDGAAGDFFGMSVSLSGDSALVGAIFADASGSNSGSAYYFKGLDDATGLATETLKLIASDGTSSNFFGSSVSMDNDRVAIGAYADDDNGISSGSAYTALISNMTTLDQGSVVRIHEAIDFESRTDWIIGQSTNDNVLTLAAGTTATVDEAGKAIRIGATVAAHGNVLILEGAIEATDLFIGSLDGNIDNQLVIDASGLLEVDNLYLAAGNQLLVEGDYADFSNLLNYLTGTTRPTTLFAGDMANGYQQIDSLNASDWLLSSYDGGSGFTTISFSSIPEPTAISLLGFLSLSLLHRRRRQSLEATNKVLSGQNIELFFKK